MSDIVVIDTTADLDTYIGNVRIQFSPSKNYLVVILEERSTTYFSCVNVEYTVPIITKGTSSKKEHKFETKYTGTFGEFLGGDLHYFKHRTTLQCTKVATMEFGKAVFEFKSRSDKNVFLKLEFNRDSEASETDHMTVEEENMFFKSLLREANSQGRIDDTLARYMKGWESRMEFIDDALKSRHGQDYRARSMRVDHQNLNCEDNRKAILELSDDFRRKVPQLLRRPP